MKTSQRGIDFIKEFESFSAKPYRCSAGKWTIGYGHVILPGERLTLITEPEACALLADDLIERERDVNDLVTVPLTQAQFDALVIFTFNVGADVDDDTIAEGLGDSTLLRKLNEGDCIGAADEFPKWDKARVNGVKVALAGLTRRRLAERALFLES